MYPFHEQKYFLFKDQWFIKTNDHTWLSNKYKSVDNYKPTGSLIYDERTMLDLSDKLKI